VIAVGVDIVDIERFRSRFVERFSLIEEIFDSEEIVDSERGRGRFACFAERFAAKEALFKALGTGLSGKMAWRDVGFVPSRSPTLRLSGKTAEAAAAMGVVACWVSVSRSQRLAIAVVLIEINAQSNRSSRAHEI
jgi:holo-[acyl-carrier protein] synthase